MSSETAGYEAEPADVAAETAWLEEFTDPLERYHRATADQAHHEAVIAELARVREQAVARMHGDGLPLRKIAELVGTSPGRVQELIRRDRQRSAPRGSSVVVTVSRADRVHTTAGDDRGRIGEVGGVEQYDSDRGWWRVAAEVRDNARYAVFAVGGTVLRAYEITGGWEPNGAGKWAFNGRLLTDDEFDTLHRAGQIPLGRGQSCPPRRGTYRPIWFTPAPQQ